MKKTLGLILLVLLMGSGCSGDRTGTNTTPVDGANAKTISVYVDEEPNNPENLKEIKIATITVASNGNLTLNILQKDNLQTKNLQQAVANITARSALKLIGESEEMINGHQALVMKDFAVLKTDSSYPFAVAKTLSMEFGLKSKVEVE